MKGPSATVVADGRRVSRLCEHGLRFLFFTDPATGRGQLLYPRYAGNPGLGCPDRRGRRGWCVVTDNPDGGSTHIRRGRVVFTRQAPPAIRPVNHLVDTGQVILRTRLTGTISTAVASEHRFRCGGGLRGRRSRPHRRLAGASLPPGWRPRSPQTAGSSTDGSIAVRDSPPVQGRRPCPARS